MPLTLKDLKDEADRRLAKGAALEALKIYRLVLEGTPLDFELRLHIGDLLAFMGKSKLALPVFQAVATHDIKSGNPLRALAAIKRMVEMGAPAKALYVGLAERYSMGSLNLGRGIRPAPADYSARVRDDIDLDYQMDPEQLALTTAQIAAFLENIKNYPPLVPPLPIFSSLEQEGFLVLLDRLRLRRCRAGEKIIVQGKVGDAIYFLARGEVTVSRQVDGEEVKLAKLGPGSLFGEMALVCSDPRSASVTCDTPVDALELARQHVDEVCQLLPQVSQAMARFTQERMINNLLTTNPIFKPFDEGTRKQLLARFTGHEVPRGTIFLEQGARGNGLYILLSGRAEVLKWDGKEYLPVAVLNPGDVAGEISLLYDEPVSATVRTMTGCTLLFLARELFQPLVDAVPELLAHFNRLAEARMADTELKMMQSTASCEDFIEELEEYLEQKEQRAKVMI